MLFAAFGITSCSEVEPLDPAIVLNPNPSNPSNPGNPGTSTGDYWPAALNNEWTYLLNGVEQTPLKMVSINSINGHTYYTFGSFPGISSGGITGTAVTRLRKTGANYYIKVEDIVTQQQGQIPGSTTTGYETIYLKDNLPVGGTWTTSYSTTTTYTDPNFPEMTMSTQATGTIEEKGIEITVGGETFTDVIKTKYVQNVTMMDQQTTATTYYWFAKDVGPVKIMTESEGAVYEQQIIDYTLN